MSAIAAAILTPIILGGLAWLISRAKPGSLSGQQGSIEPEKWSAWFTVVVGTLMLVGGLGGAIFANGGFAAILIALFGAAIAGFMAPSLTSIHIVNWNENVIEGPSKLFGPTLGRSRTQIDWGEIVKTGTTITDYWYVESSDGRRVYWSYLYKGYGSLNDAIIQYCPNLRLPNDIS